MALTINPEDRYAKQWAEGTYTDDIAEILKLILRKDDVRIDVGANVGDVSFFCSTPAGWVGSPSVLKGGR
jgi:hypothetical protein